MALWTHEPDWSSCLPDEQATKPSAAKREQEKVSVEGFLTDKTERAGQVQHPKGAGDSRQEALEVVRYVAGFRTHIHPGSMNSRQHRVGKPRGSVLQATLNLAYQVGASWYPSGFPDKTGLAQQDTRSCSRFSECWLKNGSCNHQNPRACFPYCVHVPSNHQTVRHSGQFFPKADSSCPQAHPAFGAFVCSRQPNSRLRE